MLPSTALQFVQQNPLITTNSPEFRNLVLRDDQCQELAYQLIESYPFIGQTTTVYDSKGGSSETMPITASQVGSIKKYLKAFIDVDRSALENHFQGFNAAEAKRSMVHEIIDKRQELYRLYVEYKRDVVERSAPFSLMYNAFLTSLYSSSSNSAPLAEQPSDSPNTDYSDCFITPEGARFRAEYVQSQFFDYLILG
jgi:hypothetical protein